MKNLKKPVILWGFAGILLSLCTLGVVLWGLLGEPVILVDTDAVVSAAEQTMDCVRSGDFEALEKLLSGTPDLGPAPEKSDDAAGVIWQAYLDSMEYQLGDQCYVDNGAVALDVQLSCLDISAVIASMQETVPNVTTQNSDEGHKAVLLSEAEKILSQMPMTERTLTLHFANSNNTWQVLPTDAFVRLLSGFVSE